MEHQLASALAMLSCREEGGIMSDSLNPAGNRHAIVILSTLRSVSLARLHTLQLLNFEPKSELLANIQDNGRNCRLIL
jgi:hypothetical protein